MPENLVQKIKDYNDNYTDCLNTRSYSISDTLVEKYNSAVQYINTYYPIQNPDGTKTDRYRNITSPLTGYKKISELCYDCIDMSLDLESAMGKTMQMDSKTIQETMDTLTSVHLSPVSVKTNLAYVSESVVENTLSAHVNLS